MLKQLKKQNAAYIGVASLITSLIILFNLTFDPYNLAVELKSETDGEMQVFYSSSNRFREENSLVVNIVATNTFGVYTTSLSSKFIRKIRLDPPANFQIKSVRIFNEKNSYEFKASSLFKHIENINDIQSLNLKNDYIEGRVTGNDPYFCITGLPLINDFSNAKYLLIFLVLFISFYFLYLFLWSHFIKYDYIADKKHKLIYKIPDTIFIIILISIFSWFAFQLIFYATQISNGISPDEPYHIQVIEYYSSTSLFQLKNSQIPTGLEYIKVSPYLYHLLMGKLLLLNIFDLSDIVFLRLVNVIISLVSLYLLYLLTKEFTKNRIIQISVLVLQTNILMYVFISGMVSYDNLINLFATASFLVLFRFLRTYSRVYLLTLIIIMLAGSLTKVSFGPIVIIQLLIVIFNIKSINKNRHKLISKTISSLDVFLTLAIIVFLILNLNLYVNNIVKYGHVRPSFEKIYKDKTEGYNINALYRREIELKSTLDEREIIPIPKFIEKYFYRAGQTTFGILAHKNLFKTTNDVFWYGILMLLSILFYFYYYRKIKGRLFLNIVLFSFVSYILVVLYFNFVDYTRLRVFGLALQGRYNFPIISLANIFIAFNIFAPFRNRTKLLLLMILTGIMIYNGYYWFLLHANSDWYIN